MYMGTIGSKKGIESLANKVVIRKARGEDPSGVDEFFALSGGALRI
jgi:hypothetical protein